VSYTEEIIDKLWEHNEDAELAVGLDDALIGVSLGYFHHDKAVAVYDIDEIISILVERDGMTEDGAFDYFVYNIQGSYMGEDTPLFIYTSNYNGRGL
jgi:predicted methyltransferase